MEGSNALSTGDFWLGHWRVQPALNRLSRGSETKNLEPKVMAVLLELARRPGEAVSRAELLEVVWEGAAISGGVVRRAIYELRKALEESAGGEQLIETLPRVGYRLLAQPRTVETSAEEASWGEPSGGAAGKGLRLLRPALPLVSLGLVVLAVSLSWWLLPDREGSSVARMLPEPPRPVTSFPGFEVRPDLSADGRWVAYERYDEGGTPLGIFVQPLKGGQASPLASQGVRPTFSPDGTAVAYQRRGSDGSGIYVKSVLGGTERRIAAFGETALFAMDWSPGGEVLALGMRPPGEDSSALYALALKDGRLTQLTFPPAAVPGDGDPAWSPDGSTLAFLRVVYPGDVVGLHTVDASGLGERAVIPADRRLTDVDWTADGSGLLVSVFTGGGHYLASVPASGGDPQLLSLAAEGAMEMAASATLDGEGRQLVLYSRWQIDFRFHRVGLEDGTVTPLEELSSTAVDADLAFAPDGRRAFSSSRSGNLEVWVAAADGTSQLQLTRFEGPYVGQPAWAPDGGQVAFVAAAGGNLDLYVSSPDGGNHRRLTTDGAADLLPAWSPDGRSIAFVSNRSGLWDVWVLEPENGEGLPWRLTEGGGSRARWSKDGRWIYFTRPGRDGLFRMPTASGGGEAEAVLPDLPRRQWGNWLPLEGGPSGPEVLYVAEWENRPALLRKVLGGHAEPRLAVIPLESWPLNPSLAVAPGGAWAALSWSERSGADLLVLSVVQDLLSGPSRLPARRVK